MSSILVVLRMRDTVLHWDKGEFAIQEIHGNLATLGTAQRISIGKRPFRLNSRIAGYAEVRYYKSQ